jgi:hypothetical protein
MVKEYIALFVEGIKWRSEPVFLRSVSVARITARSVFALTRISDKHSETYSPITGKTKEDVKQELEKQKAENNLFLPSLRKIPENAEIIIVPKE